MTDFSVAPLSKLQLDIVVLRHATNQSLPPISFDIGYSKSQALPNDYEIKPGSLPQQRHGVVGMISVDDAAEGIA